MSKVTSVFICQTCAYQSPKWLGQCPGCQNWNTLVETSLGPKTKTGQPAQIKPITLAEAKTTKTDRLSTGIKEMDQVLGGGITLGSVNLVAGEPGIGKSTLLSQLAIQLAGKPEVAVFYACGEESPQQVRSRMERLGIKSRAAKKIFLLPQTDVEEIIAASTPPRKQKIVLIVDSIQAMTTTDLSGGAGSIGQTKEATARLVRLAKNNQLPIFLVGHVTKEGTVAGPKTLEHMVDAVFYFEGDRHQDLRLLRSKKNRFGATDEVGVWQMTDKGLVEITDPTTAWIKKNKSTSLPPGSAITVVIEGTRPMVIEIQALVSKSFLPNPKRVINGLDYNRGQILLAIAQKHLKLPLYKMDVFINTSGGIKTKEPSVDLAVCAAILSSFKNQSLPSQSAFIGEVSLLGEVKEVSRLNKKKAEAKSIGAKKIFDHQTIPFVKKLHQLIS